MGIDLRFTDRDWARVEEAWLAWWAGDLDRPLLIIEPPVHGLQLSGGYAGNFTSNFPLELPADAVLDYYQQRLEAARYYGDAFPRWWPNFGPGIVAGFLGAKVKCAPDTVWFEPAQDDAIADLHPAYDPENVWWKRIQDLTRTAVRRWGDRVAVCHTDLGGNLDILASLRGTQQLLMDLYDSPDEVARLTGEITRLWLRYYDALAADILPAGRGTTPWAPIWSPRGRCYMLQSDFAYMISPQMFARFVLPDLAACCDALDHAFYHLDGKGQLVHLDALLALERLRGIQWVPGDGNPPPEQWPTVLKHIRDGGKLCQLFVTPEGARAIVRALGGRGFAFYIEWTLPEDEIDGFMRTLALEDARL